MLYLQRNYVELSNLFIKKKINIDYFLYRFELSKYEFKADINRLKEMSKKYGIDINVEKNDISIDIIDNDTYDKYYFSFFSFYHMNRYDFNDNDMLISLIISAELLNNEYFLIDEFSEKIGYSKSNLRRAIKMSRNFIHSHSIETLIKPYYGMYAKGNEFYIRKCLCSTYMKLVPEIIFIDISLAEQLSYNECYDVISKYLNDERLNIYSDDKKSIIYYLAVTKCRIKNGNIIDNIPNNDSIIHALKTNQYLIDLATNMFNLLGIPLIEKEIHAMTIILLDHNFSISDSKRYINELFKEEFELLKSEIYRVLNKLYGLNIDSKIYRDGIDQELISIIIKKHTGNLDKIINKASGNTPNVYSFPLVYFINNSLCKTIRIFYTMENISSAITENIADIVYYYIDSLPFSFKKYKLAIISRYNEYTPKLIKDKILKDIDNNYFDKVDIFNDPLVRWNDKKSIDNYDLILSDVNIKNDNKTILHSEINSSTLKLENYLRLHRNMCDCLSKNGLEVIVRNLKVKNEKEFIMSLANERYSYNELIKGIKFGYILKDNFIMYIPSKSDDSVLQIGKLSQEIILKDDKISNYQIYKGNINEKNAKILNIIFHEFAIDPIFLEQLNDKPSIETINEIINMIIK